MKKLRQGDAIWHLLDLVRCAFSYFIRGSLRRPLETMVRTFHAQPNQEAAQIDIARKMFLAGCMGLPWLWVVNVWYFYPMVFGRGAAAAGGGAAGGHAQPVPPVIRRSKELSKWVKRSMMGAVTGVSLFFIWILIFQLNWRRWGRPAVDFMIYAPTTYTTGW